MEEGDGHEPAAEPWTAEPPPAEPPPAGPVTGQQLTAEQRARVLIDRQLVAAGWVVQSRDDLNLFAGQGVAVREVIMAAGHGRADYLLYVDKQAVGVIEAKPAGSTLSGVEWQSAMYADGLPPQVRLKALTIDGRLPFVIEASGTETHFTNGYDPDPRARRLFAVPRPATLARVLRDAEADPGSPTWRGKVRSLPALDQAPLRPAQVTAIHGVERSLVEQRFDRSLVQMATGAGKTYTAVTSSYRLLKHGGFGRVLFLVDRNNLADQTLAEFQNYRTTDDGRRFTEIATILDTNGRAAVVLPDNVLFEGGAGETLRRRLLRDFDFHTMLRLPTGIFYAQGVKANVLFFDKKPAAERPWTQRLWVYDLRTNQHFTLKQSPLRRSHLDEFVACYAPGRSTADRVESTRFKSFSYDELMARDKANLDITWLRDESLEDLDNLPAPEVIAREIVEDLTSALAEFEAVATALEVAAVQRAVEA